MAELLLRRRASSAPVTDVFVLPLQMRLIPLPSSHQLDPPDPPPPPDPPDSYPPFQPPLLSTCSTLSPLLSTNSPPSRIFSPVLLVPIFPIDSPDPPDPPVVASTLIHTLNFITSAPPVPSLQTLSVNLELKPQLIDPTVESTGFVASLASAGDTLTFRHILRPFPDIHNFPLCSVFQVCFLYSLSVYSSTDKCEMCVEWFVLELWPLGLDCDVHMDLVSIGSIFEPSSTIIFVVPAIMVPLDIYCLFFPITPHSLSGLEDHDLPVLQGSSSRFIVSPAFVAGFFSAFVADIFSIFSTESNALTSVSDAVNRNVHEFLVFFDSSCFLLIKCIYSYLMFVATCLAKLWTLIASYLVIPPPLLMEFESY